MQQKPLPGGQGLGGENQDCTGTTAAVRLPRRALAARFLGWAPEAAAGGAGGFCPADSCAGADAGRRAFSVIISIWRRFSRLAKLTSGS